MTHNNGVTVGWDIAINVMNEYDLCGYRIQDFWFWTRGIKSWNQYWWFRSGFAKKLSYIYCNNQYHYNGVIMSAMASQITSLTIVYPNVYSGADQRKHQSSASLAFVRGIHRWPVNFSHKGPVTRKCFHFMTSSWRLRALNKIAGILRTTFSNEFTKSKCCFKFCLFSFRFCL